MGSHLMRGVTSVAGGRARKGRVRGGGDVQGGICVAGPGPAPVSSPTSCLPGSLTRRDHGE
jgi:hypothetical protein